MCAASSSSSQQRLKQNQPVRHPYQGHRQALTVHSAPLAQTTRQSPTSVAAARWPPYVDPSIMIYPGSGRRATQADFVPAYIDESFTFPPRMASAPTTSHEQETSRKAEFPSSANENLSPLSARSAVLEVQNVPGQSYIKNWLQSATESTHAGHRSVPPSTADQGVMQLDEQGLLRSASSRNGTALWLS